MQCASRQVAARAARAAALELRTERARVERERRAEAATVLQCAVRQAGARKERSKWQSVADEHGAAIVMQVGPEGGW